MWKQKNPFPLASFNRILAFFIRIMNIFSIKMMTENTFPSHQTVLRSRTYGIINTKTMQEQDTHGKYFQCI